MLRLIPGVAALPEVGDIDRVQLSGGLDLRYADDTILGTHIVVAATTDLLRRRQFKFRIRLAEMLPIVLLEIFYKVLWLILVAYPLWSKGTLAGSPAEGTTSAFLWVILPIVAVPWGYVFVNYFYKPKRVEVVL